MAYYYCNEDDTIVSTDVIRSEFEGFQREGMYLGETFSDYLEGCMWFNNGALTPLLDHANHIRRELNRVRSYNNPYNDEWIENLSAQLAECEKYYLEV